MERRVSDECSTVAFYGIEPPPEALASVYRRVLGWFETCGRSADAASVSGQGYSRKMGSFRRVESKLRTIGFERVTAFSLISLLPNANSPLDDYAIEVSISLSKGYFLVSARKSIFDLSDIMLSFTISVLDVLNSGYGIGYIRENRLGPTFYATGLSQGLGLSDREYLESLNISFWNEAMALRIWERGMLRDVYPWNFLTKPQLSQSIEGLPLEQWIERMPGRGTLSPIGDGMVLWSVEDADIPSVRRTLWQAGGIYNWSKHVEGAEGHPYAGNVQDLWL